MSEHVKKSYTCDTCPAEHHCRASYEDTPEGWTALRGDGKRRDFCPTCSKRLLLWVKGQRE